ncbi:hypothetical protein [Paenibacillus humicola]|uniref:hypothetical protein n=1 Tax=Paenibacillus humicola TaxID=3110540 RepID=UPI00237AFA16|nr:hypothetical protein [Paenibacillus humicola]
MEKNLEWKREGGAAGMRRTEAIKIAEAVLSADLACSKADFDGNGVTVRRAEIREGRFRFPIRAKSLQIVTMGRGVVAACSAERMEWAVRQLGGLTREQIFSAQTMAGIENYVSQDRQYLAGPVQKYVCAADDLKEFQIPPDVRIKTCGREQVTSLYVYPNFQKCALV